MLIAKFGMMKTMSKLTAKHVENAKPKEREYKLADGSGLYLRVRATGAKSWLFCFRLPNNRRLISMTIGSVNDLSLKEARVSLPELRKLVAEGIDPRKARAAIQTENSQAITMQMLFNAWIEFHKATKKVTSEWIKRHEDRWRLHLKKPLGDLYAKNVTRGHLAAALDGMIRKHIKEETRKALTTLNLMLDYGVSRHSIKVNPARMLKPKDFSATANRPRDRVLTLPELQALWLVLNQNMGPATGLASTAKMNITTITAIKLLILTGARRGEVAGMCWSELDLAAATWHLPSFRTKNKQSHTIYLSKLAIKLIEELKPITGKSQFVFDTMQKIEQAPIHKDTLTGAIKRLQTNAKDNSSFFDTINSFTIHDLRRSAATAWAEHLKVSPHVIEHMLNHQPLNKLVVTYQRAVYAEEQKAAWIAWGELVECQVANKIDNVIVL
jgi:integrase